MKKASTLFCFLILFVLAAHAQQVTEVQRTMITKKTATWCSHCGQWGWSFFKNVLDDNSSEAFVVAAHYSGNLTSTTASEFVSNLNDNAGQPRFFVNSDDIGVNSSNGAAKRTEVRDAVTGNQGQNVIANTGLISKIEGNELKITARTKFFTNTSGDYYVSILVMEDDVEASQSSRGVVDHARILRGAANSGTFGQQLANTDIAAGTEYVKEFTVVLSNDWNQDNLELVAVVWNKVNDKYQFVNAFLTKELNSTTTSTNDLAGEWGVSLQPRLANSHSILQLDLKDALNDATIELYDLNGKKLSSIFDGQIAAGKHSYQIDRPSAAGAGMFLLRIQSQNLQHTEKILFQ
ncbi:MAG: Omp28-related outer membrane protein [Bacteroidota bacterium]